MIIVLGTLFYRMSTKLQETQDSYEYTSGNDAKKIQRLELTCDQYELEIKRLEMSGR